MCNCTGRVLGCESNLYSCQFLITGVHLQTLISALFVFASSAAIAIQGKRWNRERKTSTSASSHIFGGSCTENFAGKLLGGGRLELLVTGRTT